jgi:hypothetical protein
MASTSGMLRLGPEESSRTISGQGEPLQSNSGSLHQDQRQKYQASPRWSGRRRQKQECLWWLRSSRDPKPFPQSIQRYARRLWRCKKQQTPLGAPNQWQIYTFQVCWGLYDRRQMEERPRTYTRNGGWSACRPAEGVRIMRYYFVTNRDPMYFKVFIKSRSISLYI